jgi:glycosyltransferase involved in cell wall biosynthesis
VNDGGEDCADLVQQFNPYVNMQYLYHPQPHGRGAALNAGWQNARGRWITYLDDDDLVFPFHLELLTQAMRSDPAARVAYSYGQKALCLRGEVEDIPLARLPMIQQEFRPETLFVENSIPIMAMMHERSLAEEIGGFDESLNVLEDWDFIIRLAQHTSFRLAPHLTAEYRFYVGTDLQNSIVQRRSELLPTIRKLYERYPTDNPGLSAQRSQVVEAVEIQLAELEKIQAMEGEAQLKNLMVLMRTSGFTLDFFRQGGFRA